METVVSVFKSRSAAEQAAHDLMKSGVFNDRIIFLTGEHAEGEVDSLPTTDAEAEGMGKTMGSYLGGVMGASAGLSLGSVLASLFVPGVGPIMAAGIGAAAVLGLGGAAAGATVGDSTEKALSTGVPRDDVPLYHELLRQRRSLVLVSADSEQAIDLAQSVLKDHGGQDVEDERKEIQDSRPGGEMRRAS